MARKTQELTELTPEELRTRVADAKATLFNLRFQHVTGQLEDTARLGVVRKEIARLSTLLRQREIEAAEAAGGDR